MKKLTLSTFFILLSLTGCSEKKSDSASQAPAKEINPEVVNLRINWIALLKLRFMKTIKTIFKSLMKKKNNSFLDDLC